MAPKPPTVIDLSWDGDLRFVVRLPRPASQAPGVADAAGAAVADAPAPPSFVLDSTGKAGPSPVTALVAALAGCMSIDIAYILNRGRHPLRHLETRIEANRSPEEPHRVVGVTLHVEVTGDVPADAVQRAITLSHDKYCSVWHSLRQDITFQVTFALRA